MTTGKTIALTRRTFVGKVMSLLLNMLSRLVLTFLPRSKLLLMGALGAQKFTLQGQNHWWLWHPRLLIRQEILHLSYLVWDAPPHPVSERGRRPCLRSKASRRRPWLPSVTPCREHRANHSDSRQGTSWLTIPFPLILLFIFRSFWFHRSFWFNNIFHPNSC